MNKYLFIAYKNIEDQEVKKQKYMCIERKTKTVAVNHG